MPRDIQFDVLERVRREGIVGDAILYLSRRDAKRLVDGFQEINADIVEPEHVDRYHGTVDNEGHLLYRLDERLSSGVGAIEQEPQQRVFIPLAGVIR